MKTNYPNHFVAWLALLTLACVPSASAFYNPTAGRWLSRDPIYERGGPNLNQFLNNSAITSIDPIGLDGWNCGGTSSLGRTFQWDEQDGACTIKVEIIPYAYRCFRDTVPIGNNDPNNFFTTIQIKTRRTRTCPCQSDKDLGTRYDYCLPLGPPGTFIKPTLENFASTFPKPDTSAEFLNAFCDGAHAAFPNPN